MGVIREQDDFAHNKHDLAGGLLTNDVLGSSGRRGLTGSAPAGWVGGRVVRLVYYKGRRWRQGTAVVGWGFLFFFQKKISGLASPEGNKIGHN